MSPGLDFQEAFLLIFAEPINLILGLSLATGLLIAMVRILLSFTRPKRERPPEIGNE